MKGEGPLGKLTGPEALIPLKICQFARMWLGSGLWGERFLVLGFGPG